MVKQCKIHGNVEHSVRKEGGYRCKQCAVDAVTRRRNKVKADSIAYLGGKCEICGYSKCIGALEFHHVDPNTKSFGIAKNGHTRAWEKVKLELDKCKLLCANCHREQHC